MNASAFSAALPRSARSTLQRWLPITRYALLLLLGGVASAQAAIPPEQRQVLIDLYTSTNGASWTNNTGWNGAAGTECSWFGVTCDAGENNVITIDLGSNNLTGSLPALAGLTNLDTFVAFNNQLTGSLPTLSGLTALFEFDVHSNQLTGSLPP